MLPPAGQKWLFPPLYCVPKRLLKPMTSVLFLGFVVFMALSLLPHKHNSSLNFTNHFSGNDTSKNGTAKNNWSRHLESWLLAKTFWSFRLAAYGFNVMPIGVEYVSPEIILVVLGIKLRLPE